MKSVSAILAFFISVSAFSQKTKNYFEENGVKIEFETENGKINGKYQSKYKGGNVRAEGSFCNNVRTGIWTVYDSAGRKIHQRNYFHDHLSYDKIYPEKESKGPASLLDTSFYSVVRDTSGLVPYFELKERNVIYSWRLWRKISPKQNKLFFDKDLLYKTLYNFLTDSSNLSYCSADQDFGTQIFPSQIKKYSLDKYKIIDWKIKEDHVFDVERMVSDVRIIGICPVGINKSTKDTSELYWIYFPYVRKPMSLVKTKIKDVNGELMTLDDLFFYRNFSSVIEKQSNSKDLWINDYCHTKEEILKEQQRIEINLIETEHEIWLGNLPY